MPVEKTEKRVYLKHPKGATAEIMYFGAHVLSWKSGTPANPSAPPAERLYMSEKSWLDEVRPVRGGIPIAWPLFAEPTHPEHVRLQLPLHGFVRTERWAFDSVVLDSDAGVSVRFTLSPNATTQALHPQPWALAYVVTLTEHSLTTDLHVTNPADASAPLDFQALFHTYIAAPANHATMTPFKGLKYLDRLDGKAMASGELKEESRDVVDVKVATGNVYEGVVDAEKGGKVDLRWPEGHVELGMRGFKDVVVWNPQEAYGAGVADLEFGGWEKFVCVEPGYARGFVSLAPGKTWLGQQTLKVVQ